MAAGAGALTKYVDQFDRKNLDITQLGEAIKQDDLADVLGQSIRQEGVTNVGIIAGTALQASGAAIQMIGSTVQEALKTKQISVIAKARVQCLALQVAEKGIVATQDSFKELIAMFKDQVALQQHTLKAIKEIDERHRADIDKHYQKVADIVIRDDFDKVGQILINAADKQLAALERGNDATHASLKALAESCKIDPEILKKCADQTYAIIREISKTVRALSGQDNESINQLAEESFGAIKKALDESKDIKALPAPAAEVPAQI